MLTSRYASHDGGELGCGALERASNVLTEAFDVSTMGTEASTRTCSAMSPGSNVTSLVANQPRNESGLTSV